MLPIIENADAAAIHNGPLENMLTRLMVQREQRGDMSRNPLRFGKR